MGATRVAGLAAFAGLMLIGASEPDVIAYRVTPDPAAQAVIFELSFRGDADGETAIGLPGEWAGSRELWKGVTDPRVTGGTLAPSPSPDRWVVRHRPGARVTVRYVVRDAQPGLPDAATYEKARPVVERDWFYLHNEGVIAIPEGRNATRATFAFGPVPAGWRVGSDLERADAARLTANDVGGGVIVGGRAMRIVEREIGGATLRVAMLGDWPFADAALADRVARLIRTENAMLGAGAIDYFVPVGPLTGSATGGYSYGGSGRTAGFALMSTDNVPLGEIERLLAHEYGHRWFGKSFGAVPEGAGPYWFTEGVNDWFAGRAMVAAGPWSRADWVAALNRVLLRYGSSGARSLTDAQITEQFWTNQDAQQVQYDRGQLTALLLDRALADRGGLIGVLRAMAANRDAGDQVARFARLVDARVAGGVPAARTRVAGALEPDAFGACGRLEAVRQPNYARGFTIDPTTRIVREVTGGPAAAAGIRPGMTYIRRIDSTPNDSSKPFRAEFDDGGTRRTIEWLPAGDRTVTFQRFVVPDPDSPACIALIG